MPTTAASTIQPVDGDGEVHDDCSTNENLETKVGPSSAESNVQVLPGFVRPILAPSNAGIIKKHVKTRQHGVEEE